jgi:hypothetical protein
LEFNESVSEVGYLINKEIEYLEEKDILFTGA